VQPGTIRVLLYCDQPILAKGWEAVLSGTPPFRFEGSLFSLRDLLDHTRNSNLDILLLDLKPAEAIAVISDIKQIEKDIKLVLWVDVISTGQAFQAMGLGVRGILRKNLSVELQVKCLRKIYEGELWFEKSLIDKFVTFKRVTLSPREDQLISLLSQGLKNKEIGSTLQISEGTVKVYLSHLFRKVGVKDRLELALFGLRH
jgi:two-component system nitrate/nitrite response regulator NarL